MEVEKHAIDNFGNQQLQASHIHRKIYYIVYRRDRRNLVALNHVSLRIVIIAIVSIDAYRIVHT